MRTKHQLIAEQIISGTNIAIKDTSHTKATNTFNHITRALLDTNHITVTTENQTTKVTNAGTLTITDKPNKNTTTINADCQPTKTKDQ